MVGAIVLSPTDAAKQEAVVGSEYCVVGARARAPRDAAMQQSQEYLGSEHPDLELERSARSVVEFDGVLSEVAQCVAYAPIDLDGQVGIVVDVLLEEYEFVRLLILRIVGVMLTYLVYPINIPPCFFKVNVVLL